MIGHPVHHTHYKFTKIISQIYRIDLVLKFEASTFIVIIAESTYSPKSDKTSMYPQGAIKRFILKRVLPTLFSLSPLTLKLTRYHTF